MKNLSVVFLSVFVFLAGTIMVSHAAIVPGVYTSSPNYTVVVQSMNNGLFGVGDTAYANRTDGLVSSISVRTVPDTYGTFHVTDSTHGYRTARSERQGVAIFDEEVWGSSYTANFVSIADTTQYLTLNTTDGIWYLDYAVGTSVNNGIFNEAQYVYTSIYGFSYSNSDITTVPDTNGYNYLTFEQSLITTTVSAVPAPGTMILLGMGLVGLAGLKRRQI